MKLTDRLRKIFRESEEAFGHSDSAGTPCLVPYCEQIVELYRANSMEKGNVEKAFIDDFEHHHECTWELAQVCMYHLKLPKYKDYLQEKLKVAHDKNDWRSTAVISNILNAYEEPFEDKALFYGAQS
ncbi:hypothetical protein [Microbulbifer sp. ANSA005]|uniref:hypothetical protein n=1 Tax=unclassified Microbulbifer TaxID=2619833 RepID=UPI004041287C